MRYRYYESPLGKLLLAAEEESITGLWMENQKYYPDVEEMIPAKPGDETLEAAAAWLDRYFAGKRPSASELSLTPRGSEFRQRVWRLLCEIPCGEVTSYGDIARKLSERYPEKRTSARAVGGAIGHNPISILIPCHRVVGSDGSLTGYAGGVDRKRWLLAFENALDKKAYVQN